MNTMSKQDFLHFADKKIPKIKPSANTEAVLGGLVIVAAISPLLLSRGALGEGQGNRIARSLTSRRVASGEPLKTIEDYEAVATMLEDGELVAPAIVDGEFYATEAAEFPESGGVVVPVQSEEQIAALKVEGVGDVRKLLIMPGSWNILDEQLRRLGLSGEDLAKRREMAGQYIQRATTSKDWHFGFADDPSGTAQEVAQSLMNSTPVQENVRRARALGNSIISRLGR